MTKVFNDIQQGDVLTVEMRVSEVSRRILQKMFMSSTETQELLLKGLEAACGKSNVGALMEAEASKAIEAAVSDYFKYGNGGTVIREVVKDAMDRRLSGVAAAIAGRKKKR